MRKEVHFEKTKTQNGHDHPCEFVSSWASSRHLVLETQLCRDDVIGRYKAYLNFFLLIWNRLGHPVFPFIKGLNLLLPPHDIKKVGHRKKDSSRSILVRGVSEGGAGGHLRPCWWWCQSCQFLTIESFKSFLKKSIVFLRAMAYSIVSCLVIMEYGWNSTIFGLT